MAWPPVGPLGQTSSPADGRTTSHHHRTPSTAAHASRRRAHPDPLPTNLNPTVSNSLDPVSLGSLDIAQLQVESSSDSDAQHSRHPSKPSHGRSMSNPFPSLFSTKKKKKARDQSPSGFSDSESSDEAGPMHKSRGSKQAPLHSLAAAGPGRGNSFTTGPCITCGSLMRWAQGVEAFRCSICLTVNDLVPGGRVPATGSGKHTRASQARDDGAPISVERTRALAQQCIRSYLTAVLSNVHAGHDVPPRQMHPTPSSASSPLKANQRPDISSTGPTVAAGTDRAESGRPLFPPSDSGARTANSPTRRALPSNRPPRNSKTTQKLLPTPPGPVLGERPSRLPSVHSFPQTLPQGVDKTREETEAKRIFKQLEDDIITHFLSINCLDSSFVPSQPVVNQGHRREVSEASHHTSYAHEDLSVSVGESGLPELDHKLLLLGDVAENGSWWTGHQIPRRPTHPDHRRQRSESGVVSSSSCATRPIRIDWPAVDEWFNTVVNVGATWTEVYNHLVESNTCVSQPKILLEQIEAEILKGQNHVQRVLLKAIETVLKRPGRRIGESGDFRFLIMALANPLLHASCRPFAGVFQRTAHTQQSRHQQKHEASRGNGPASGQHSVIIKRILGLISNASDERQRHVTSCFSHFSVARFMQMKDLVGGFLAYRLVRHNEKKEESKDEFAEELVPRVSEGASAASLQAALSQTSGPAKKPKTKAEKKLSHGDDWQIKAAVRVLGLLFNANSAAYAHRHASDGLLDDKEKPGMGPRANLNGQLLPTSDFYMTLLDNCDLVADFESWELKTPKFTFCRYPFLLSIWAKIQILEHEAHRQMRTKARDAFFDSIMTHRDFDQHFSLRVRRDCLVDDSLTAVSEAVGSGGEDLKKGLRIVFRGEEGIDAGGLRKEWFLLLVREVFNPDHGMFSYNDDSRYCYFNPNSFETSDQFFLVGVVLGLAIYNSTILDIALPPFAFRKLLLAGPEAPAGMITGMTRPPISYTLADLAEYRPGLAKGLQQLLDYEGDVESAFSLDFTIPAEKYGVMEQVPLCVDGEKRPVTGSNRREYVHLYVRYLLDTGVSQQFEPFKRGFFTVCDSNALLLFRPEEIELLVRGSDERLDITSLRMAASYDNWGAHSSPESEPTIRWFWQAFEEASPQDQRKLLTFITGSDRIPATGPASLSIRILCLGNDTGRYPTARTCFNTLTLYRYRSKEALQKRLWEAVNESEGFGLK
ncbi:ubiquitin-protein ligase [Grosmannia clavigera kw1407]|uniref:HECT-type E3 ubiquitin transferase n=1 Tax=Grosmannia clavigera (strain kw1407 / UAMH 11150) TaxID=655863 RepID=F0X7Y3_GROCL|nr:ubiquitin-protein ligase [Grosmannia clavigera kw1407]EFX06337.1 ubiquitin-protein ligase [Grosmannia clavigera kw1407]